MFGMSGMPGILGKMKELQERMKEAQESLGQLSATADAGAGLVKATVNGRKQLVKLEIDPDLVKPEDREMLQDLVVAATNKAMEAIEEQIKTHLGQATEGLLPNIPGLDLGSLMK
ncbi:MAG: YbaB/EbfC family nucleoid-associated protein [Cytophagaceae bacterium]|nr:YbaB/EbfC family nucleoid-associated protein [Cytophagaceae bacterium]